MIKEILIVYLCVPFLMWGVMTNSKKIVGLCMCVAFASGMFHIISHGAYKGFICQASKSEDGKRYIAVNCTLKGCVFNEDVEVVK